MRTVREWLNRVAALFYQRRSDDDLEQELASHVALAREAAERRGGVTSDPQRAARRQTGGTAQAMEALRDQRGVPSIHALSSDIVFGWRQLNKHRSASGAAILSLGLAIGATTAGFRLVDAVLLRPLPVRDPGSLSYVAFTIHDSQNREEELDDFDYPTYQKYAEVIGRRADVMIVGMSAPQENVLISGDPETVFRQYLSGNVFPSFGLQPAAGRLLMPSDDDPPGAHPVTVLSYDYWTRRFARAPGAIGQTIRVGRQAFEIVGVAPKGFFGTEPGRTTDLFMPATMNEPALKSPGWSWFRLWVRPQPSVGTAEIQQLLQTAFTDQHRREASGFPPETSRQRIEAHLNERIFLVSAASGASGIQKNFRRPLWVLAALVSLVLLIACTNVANLLLAQALSRGREMALRVSIGAERWRLVRLVLVESALLAIAATAVGTLFGSWAAPMVVSMLASTDNPVRLVLETDWRAIAFSLTLATSVTCLFGLAPAIRASSFGPLMALKGGSDPRGHRRVMKSLVAAQMAFCVFVLFVAVLFAATLTRLLRLPLGFSHEHVLLIDAQLPGKPQPVETWTQIIDRLRQSPGVESATFSGWTFLSGSRWSGQVFVPGRAPETRPAYLMEIAPRFFETLNIPLIAGRDFHSGDVAPKVDEQNVVTPGVAIVNQSFARVYFDGQNPVGRRVARRPRNLVEAPVEIVGLVADSIYSDVREPMHPSMFLPAGARSNGTLSVRTAGDPLMFASTLRQIVSGTAQGTRVRVGEMSALVRQQMIRERLLATLSGFFAIVALVLACLGLYGVLNYTVVQQRRDIGLRMALGARAAQVVTGLTRETMIMVAVGAAIGLAAGLSFGRVIERLLFEVRAMDLVALLTPLMMLSIAIAIAAIPPALRAARVDPAEILRSE
jgi:putative ABC transport system permease protein